MCLVCFLRPISYKIKHARLLSIYTSDRGRPLLDVSPFPQPISVSPLFAAELVAYNKFIRAFHWRLLPAEASDKVDESSETESNCKAVGHKFNTVSWKRLKISVELKGGAEMVIIHCGYITSSNTHTQKKYAAFSQFFIIRFSRAHTGFSHVHTQQLGHY